MKKTLSLLILMLYIGIGHSQVSESGIPYSFQVHKQNRDISKSFEIIELNAPSQYDIDSVDILNSLKGNPYRIAKNIKYETHLHEHGTWEQLENGQFVWRLGININSAKALGLYFENQITIPKGDKFYIYNANKTQKIGAFTSQVPGFYATEMIIGDFIILEYNLEKGPIRLPEFNLKSIAYYYRGLDSRFNEPISDRAEACQVDVACSEIAGWQKQKDAIVKFTYVEDNDTYSCSGTVINNTTNDCTPYILSANHCGEPNSTQDLNSNVWYFNYQRPTCSPGNTTPYNGRLTQTVSGGYFRAASSLGTHSSIDPGQTDGSDFLLVELDTIPENYDPYYAGWYKGTASSSSGVCIHHPKGHEKKISTYKSSLTSATYNGGWTDAHWEVEWSQTTNGHGVTEPGSSGGPIFNSNGLLIGQLSGGTAFCATPTKTDLFGKFNKAWSADGNSINSQLKPWLDPLNIGVSSLEGTYYPCDGSSGNQDEYCEASSIECDEYISKVTLGGISNSSNCTNYKLYWENSPFDIHVGSTYLLEIIPDIIGSNGIGYHGDQIAAWVDWNGDGDFYDADENVLSDIIDSNLTVLPIKNSITAPDGFAENGITRLRVRIIYNEKTEGIIKPCRNSEFGEVEDYILNIHGGIANTNSIQSPKFNIYPNPSVGIFNIQFDNTNLKSKTIKVLSITGKQILNLKSNESDLIINLSDQPSGIYFLSIQDALNYSINRIVVQ